MADTAGAGGKSQAVVWVGRMETEKSQPMMRVAGMQAGSQAELNESPQRPESFCNHWTICSMGNPETSQSRRLESGSLSLSYFRTPAWVLAPTSLGLHTLA